MRQYTPNKFIPPRESSKFARVCPACHSNIWLLALLLCTSLCTSVESAPQLLKNPGFEQGISDWRHNGFNMEAEFNHVHSGLSSVKCTGRSKSYQGPSQQIHVTPGGRYAFQAYIQLIDSVDNKLYETAVVKIRFTWKNDGSRTYFATAECSLLRTLLFLIDSTVKLYCMLRVSAQRFDIGSNFDRKDLMIQLDLSKHQFGFGPLVRPENVIDLDFTQYQNIVYHMFNWATIGDYKWRYNRGNRTHPDYSAAVKAIDELIKHGLKVRGHCMFWAVDGHSPDYVDSLSGAELKAEVEKHIRYMTSITKGKLAQWDVNNELVHGNYFERKTNDPNFTKYMFQSGHAQDPVPKLCLNEYNVVASGEATLTYLAQIQDFKSANVWLGAVGVQSHLPDFTEPDTTLMKVCTGLAFQTSTHV
ncbi:hypothetical protein RRG08_064081 [Elysia crispata]|uniref:GH10 domain-containing protein n=1 Tax=Elysia crispata TaxID=231223 RepID=A0AAE0YGJ2_9GAST|nr:hypothetical protein RRG08_064081 [Elysia crispata]